MFEGPGASEKVRGELRQLAPGALRAELDRVDPATAARLHPNDVRRTIRALEVYRLTGVPISAHQRQWDREEHRRRDCVLIGLDWTAEALNPRINARVKEMIARGLAEEARGLWERGAFATHPNPSQREGLERRTHPPAPSLGEGELNQAREALGYKQLIEHFEGRCPLDEAIEEIKVETRRFAKNQRTWMRRLRATPGSVWIEAGATPVGEWAGIVVRAMRGGDR